MPRRFNYTNRQRILREHVGIRIMRDGRHLTFDADLDLSSYGFEKLSPRPKLYVEAYRGGTASWKRFDFGRVGMLMPPEDRSIAEFRAPEGILFRVRVTATDSRGSGRLVGEADGIRPTMPGEDQQPVQPLIQHLAVDDIGDELWRVDFSGEMPLLKVNSRLTIGVDQFLMDPQSRATFAPAVMRQVLGRILLIEKNAGDEDDDADWRQRWLRFAVLMSGLESPDPAEGPDAVQPIEEWIDTAVEGFARRAGLKAMLDAEMRYEALEVQ
jgi:hypothetical protein